MANKEHLELLKRGTGEWDQWREEHPAVHPDLRKADLSEFFLSGANLEDVDLRLANLSGADLSEAVLYDADLSDANLSGANLQRAILNDANLSGANLTRADLRVATLDGTNLTRATLWGASLRGADLIAADLHTANLTGADLRLANLSYARLTETNLTRANLSWASLACALLVKTNLTEAILSSCRVYGIGAWDVDLQGANQHDLIITPESEQTITVDSLEVAQFIFLLLTKPGIREVIDTVARKAVLILGRFTTQQRQALLGALKDALRAEAYLPLWLDFGKPNLVSDFEEPGRRSLTETLRTLAHLSRFIIVDLTDAGSIPQELAAIVPTLALPLCPLLEEGREASALELDQLAAHQGLLPVYRYTSQADLLQGMKARVIDPAEQKAQELARR